MADQEDEGMRMAQRLSTSPEPKRSKPGENSGAGEEYPAPEESLEVKNRRIQRDLMAAAAEKRIAAAKNASQMNNDSGKDRKVPEKRVDKDASCSSMAIKNSEPAKDIKSNEAVISKIGSSQTLSEKEAEDLFLIIFGKNFSKDILVQWCNQGISFSDDPETSMGLVQHEGGPCGVLAAIQAFVLKYLVFSTEEFDGAIPSMPRLPVRRAPDRECVASEILSSLSEEKRSRALVKSMAEILFSCGHNKQVVIASLNTVDGDRPLKGSEDEVFGKVSIESGSDLQKVLAIYTSNSTVSALRMLDAMLPVFRSRFGALLFLISALLSRGLDNVQEDRDDPTQPLVTAPFGHASQEIVNLLLSGCAVANVFDGNIDLGDGMFVKGVTTSVEVGFLALLESLNFCKVGQYLKCPRWPIWVVGSDSHYTVLFAFDTKVQDENELENREAQIRRAFDAEDQSGGGGFISVEGFHKVLRETNINFPPEKADQLCSMGFIVWSEFWQALLELDQSSGGVKDSTGLMGKKVFTLYHFNGIAKAIPSGSSGSNQASGNESPIQRPRLTKLKVSVPPRWTPEEFMADVPVTPGEVDKSAEVPKPQHAQLVDCIRTRWPRSVCNWEGDAPSIV